VDSSSLEREKWNWSKTDNWTTGSAAEDQWLEGVKEGPTGNLKERDPLVQGLSAGQHVHTILEWTGKRSAGVEETTKARTCNVKTSKVQMVRMGEKYQSQGCVWRGTDWIWGRQGHPGGET